MSVKPITPEEAAAGKSIPDPVIEAFNTLITANLRNGKATVYQKDVVALITEKTHYSKQDIYNNGWLDVEDLFRQYGWDVSYDKPGYNETYDAFFEFKRHNPRLGPHL